MKTLYVLLFCLVVVPMEVQSQSEELDLKVLLGKWKLDMSPQDQTDANFAMMEITDVQDNSFEGDFYREGVKIRSARINTQMGIIYGALISGDNSGTYNTAFYYVDGKLQGSTHAVNRNFLAVWTAIKED